MIAIDRPQELARDADEARILAAFRAMDARHKNENLAQMESDASKYPCHAKPTLRLVAGGVA